MARIRTIKPEFWTSEQVVDCSPTARLMFIGMWTFADDGGVLPDSWKRIKMQVFPGDSLDKDQINDLIRELLEVGLVRRFTHGGTAYLLIKGWNHQKIEKKSYKFPQPNSSTVFDDLSTTYRRPVDDDSPADSKGVEGSGEERKGSNTLSDSEAEVGRHEYQSDFETFWKSYPSRRRTKKQEAYRKWKQALKRVDAKVLIQRAKEYAASEQGKSEFAVMPSVWLNGAMWEDDPEAWTRGSDEPKDGPKLSRVFDPAVLETDPYALAEYGYGPDKDALAKLEAKKKANGVAT